MKKLSVLAIVFAVGFLMSAGKTQAQTTDTTTLDWSKSPWEVSIQGGAAIPNNDKSDAGANFTGRITYDINPKVAVGVTAGWLSYDFSADHTTGKVDFGDVHGMPLLATVVLKMPLESTGNRIVPYIVGGVGTIFWSFNENEGVDAGDDTTFGALAGAGADWYFTDHLALFGEASYLFSDDLKTGTTVNGVSGDIDENVNNFMIGAGLKAKF